MNKCQGCLQFKNSTAPLFPCSTFMRMLTFCPGHVALASLLALYHACSRQIPSEPLQS